MNSVGESHTRQLYPSARLFLTRTALVEEYPHAEYVYGRWDTVFGAWKRTAQAGAVEFVPNFAFEVTAPSVQCVDPKPWYGNPGRPVKLSKVVEDYQDLFQMDLFDLPDPEESPEEINAYLALIPKRFQQATTALGTFAWLGLEACWYFEEFSDWLLRSHWHGRLASMVWYLADAKRLSRPERRAIHEHIYNVRPLTLLSRFLPEAKARRCLSLLRRLSGRGIDDCDLRGLCVLVRSPQRTRALSHLHDLRTKSLRVLAELPAWLEQQAALAGVLKGGDAAVDFLVEIEFHPKLLDKASQTWIAKRMEAIRDPADADELEERWERRLAAVTPFPNPPIDLPAPFKPIDTFERLQQEGRQMENCSAKYLTEILAGKSYFYHWSGSEPATVRLKYMAGQWQPKEIKGVGNEDIPPGTVITIQQIVVQAHKGRKIDCTKCWYLRRESNSV